MNGYLDLFDIVVRSFDRLRTNGIQLFFLYSSIIYHLPSTVYRLSFLS